MNLTVPHVSEKALVYTLPVTYAEIPLPVCQLPVESVCTLSQLHRASRLVSNVILEVVK